LSAQVLGFSNRWYPDALRTAEQVQLSGRLVIRALDAPYFLGPSSKPSTDVEVMTTCIACFRPALVFHPRRGQQYQITVDAAVEGVDFVTMPITH
jgi:hypothetical protein